MRQVLILSLGLAGSLALAWSVYTQEDVEREETDVAMYADPGDSLTRIAWDDDNGLIRIEERTDAKGSYLWVDITEQVPVADAGADLDGDSDTGVPEVEYETVQRAFRANAEAASVWAQYAPLYAIRDLTEGGMMEAYGLDDPEATLSVTTRDGELTFNVGTETYGARDRYVGDGERIFLVDDAVLRPIMFAKTRLVERGLIPYAQPDIAAIAVSANGQSVVWTQQNRDDRGAHYWAPEGAEDDANDAVKSWMRKLLSVRSQSYLTEADLDIELESVLTYTARGDDDAFAVEVLREVTEDDNPRWFAKSEHARSLVELTRSLATDAFMDVAVVLEP